MPIFTTTELREALNLVPHWFRTIKIPVHDIQCFKYSFGKHSKQYFLLMLPKATAPKRDKIILYYHGGGWRAGSPEMFKANAKVFIDQGYPVVMPAHRKTPKYNYQAIREDLSVGLLKILEALQTHQLADKKIVLGGMSSGANLVALMLYDRKTLQGIGLSQKIFAGIFLCGAPLDLNKMRDSFPLISFTGKRTEAMFQQANPINYLQEKESLPILFIHGKKDGFVPFLAGYNFIQKFKEKHAHLLTEFIIEKGSHMDAGNWVFYDRPLRKTLLKWLEERT